MDPETQSENLKPMRLREKATRGIIWSAIQKWGRAGVSTVTFIVLSRLLTPEAFGLVALATIFTDFVQIFLDQGSSTAIVQRAEVDRSHLDTAFWMSIATSLLMTLGGIALSGSIAAFYKQPEVAPILRWLSVGFIIDALSTTQLAILQRKLAFKSLAARSLTASTVGGIVGISMALTGFGVWSLVGQELVRAASAAIFLWRASDWRPGFNLSKKHYKELFTFGISVIGNNLFEVIGKRSDDFLIGYFLGPTLLGFYTIGYRLLLVIIRLVSEIINTVAFPTFSRLQLQPERMKKAFYNVTRFTTLLAFPVFLGLAALAPILVPTLFGAKWAPSIPVMQVLAFVGILQAILIFNANVIRAAGKPSWEFGMMLLNTVCNVISFLIAVRWGIVAVATSLVIVGYLLSPISFLAVRRLTHIEIWTYLRQFAPPLLATIVMVAVIMGLERFFRDQPLNQYLELSVYVLAGGLTYLLVLGLIARSLYREVFDIFRLLIPTSKLKKIS